MCVQSISILSIWSHLLLFVGQFDVTDDVWPVYPDIFFSDRNWFVYFWWWSLLFSTFHIRKRRPIGAVVRAAVQRSDDIASRVWIPLWILRMRPYKPKSRVSTSVALKGTLTAKDHRSKYGALSLLMVTTAIQLKNCSCGYIQSNKQNELI
jgi:hypothetical protein